MRQDDIEFWDENAERFQKIRRKSESTNKSHSNGHTARRWKENERRKAAKRKP